MFNPQNLSGQARESTRGYYKWLEALAADRFSHLSDEELSTKFGRASAHLLVHSVNAMRGRIMHPGLVETRTKPSWRKLTVATLPVLASHVVLLAIEYRRRFVAETDEQFLGELFEQENGRLLQQRQLWARVRRN